MGGLLISTLGTLSPQAYYLFIIIVAVGFFGVYVPWNEKKKRQGGQRPQPPKTSTPPERPGDRKRLEQLESLRDAGVLTADEYREKRTELLEGRK